MHLISQAHIPSKIKQVSVVQIVVRMMMRNEDAFQCVEPKACLHDLSGNAIATINDIKGTSDYDGI
jgi:hypothetical protein